MIIVARFLTLPFVVILFVFLGFSCLNRSAEKSLEANRVNIPYDAIIVPGFPFEDSVWHDVMKIRVYWSHYLYEQGYTKNIIYSGSAVYSPYVESKVMKKYGVALGIPAENIFVDTVAKHSTENLYYSYQLAKTLGFDKIALATDPFQNAPLKRFAISNGIDVDFLPIVFDTLKEIEKTNPAIDPSGAYVDNFVALPEKKGFFERLKGTLGKNIDPDVYTKNVGEKQSSL